jgi:phospholipase C
MCVNIGAMNARIGPLTLVLAAVFAVGCSNPANPTDASDALDAASDVGDDTIAMDVAPTDATDAPRDVMYVRPPPIMRTESESVLSARRQGCGFDAGAWPAETLGTEIPVGDDIPIDHVLVVMMENRSFDSYYAHLPQYGQPDVEVPPAGWSNPNASGAAVMPTHDTTQYCFEDTDHSWNGSHREWNNGANDGFVVENDPNGERALFYYDQTDIPFYYSLSNTFAIADHYFCSLLGPTNPNRFFAMAATSFGHTYNAPYVADSVAHPVNQIFLEMDRAGFDWMNYAAGLRSIALFPNYAILNRANARHLVSITQLMSDLASGNLPQLSWIDPIFGGAAGDENDEHPPGTPMGGEAFVESIVRGLMASPAWSRSVLFITYDEHGGIADHVPPPEACAPDDSPPVDSSGSPVSGGGFDRLGFRVPFIVVSPYAKRHFVSHAVYDHGSLLRFIEARFGLPAMTRRDANATPPMEMFDFANPPFATPPTDLARGRGVDAAIRDRCNAQFPSSGP